MKRRKIRELVLKSLFACEIEDGDPFRQFQYILGDYEMAGFHEDEPAPVLSGTEKTYVSRLIEGIVSHKAELDEIISRHAVDWEIDRLGGLERNIMRLAFFEMLYDKLPRAIAINEAVELTKLYSMPEAVGFVNGILDKKPNEAGGTRLFTILEKEDLGNKVYGFVMKAPRIADKAQPGQFFIIRQGENFERIPLTIADFDRDNQTVTMVFQAVGASTTALSTLDVGMEVTDMVGPLGKPSEIEKLGKVVLVGGGVGIAPIYPIARALKQAGNEVISIIGARSKNLLFWEDRMREASNRLLVATDDGSYGHKGFVTTLLEELIQTEDIARVWAIGPMVMMRAVVNMTRPYGTPTIVSMNPVMVDGTGMCGACRVSVGGKTMFACVDGPEFDGHAVDFDLAMKRAAMFKDKEKEAMEAYEAGRLQAASPEGESCQCQTK